jgi:ferredoxin-NADP reductase
MIKTFQAALTNRVELTHDIYLFSFEIVGDTLEFVAGQYLIMLIAQSEGSIARRLYSISSASQNKNKFDLLVKRIPGGVASNFLSGLHIGEKATFQGPAGVFTMQNSVPGMTKIFLATSTGIAPIYSMLLSRALSGVTNEKWYLFWGVRTSNDLHWLKEFNEIKAKNPNFQFIACLSREPDLKKTLPVACTLGRIDACFQQNILKTIKGNTQMLNSFEYYLCGSVNAVEALRQDLLAEGIDKKQIHFEKFV